jgi:hypothetical protein
MRWSSPNSVGIARPTRFITPTREARKSACTDHKTSGVPKEPLPVLGVAGSEAAISDILSSTALESFRANASTRLIGEEF